MVVVDNSGNRRVIRVRGGKKLVKHFKVMVDFGLLIGQEFATVW